MFTAIHDPVNQQVLPPTISQADQARIGMVHEPDPAARRWTELLQGISDEYGVFQSVASLVEWPEHQLVTLASQRISNRVYGSSPGR